VDRIASQSPDTPPVLKYATSALARRADILPSAGPEPTSFVPLPDNWANLATSADVRPMPVPVVPGTTTLVALIPAHNEASDILETVRSLQRQSRPPDRIVVVADNCTDATVMLAHSAGAEVIETVHNKHKKAGALNQALNAVMPTLQDSDVVLAMDADSQLMPDFIDKGLRYLAYSPQRGAISGSYIARKDPSIVGLLQRIEYAQGLRTVHDRGGRIHVLSGAACMATVQALRAVASLRGSPILPGPRGWVYHEESLTEDYELTVALKRIGYEPLNARDCIVITDVMTTWKDWSIQRVRWQRGTLDTLSMYGWVLHTRKAWMVQGWSYFRSTIPLLMILFWAYALTFETVTFQPFWTAVIPIFMIDQLVASWKAGWRGRLYALVILPMWLYDLVQSFVYWRALLRSLRRSEAVWIT
jgi:biofilm PGA synthesis N-glycosyltransferase PgaC